MPVDLRSDTVTRPTPEMREAMARAEVGDDVYGEDPAVNALENEVAELFGHEAAVFCPSGSMANQVAVQTLGGPGGELLCDSDAHVVTFEGGAAAAYGGISSRTWPTRGGHLDVDTVAAFIRPGGGYAVPTVAIAVENTHNLGGGRVIPIAKLRRLREIADERGIALHLDGARIWNAHVADGVPLHEYGELFDTVSVCLSKGLGAPVGSLMISNRERVAAGRVVRKRLGGGMRQAGILAEAGRHALRHHIARLADDHVHAQRLAEALAPYGVCEASDTQTNIVVLTVPDAGGLAAAAREEGVLVSALGPNLLRMVTHMDVDEAGVAHAVKVLTSLLSRGERAAES
ncbi:GntG family PLP-dependent aldolase [Phytomonospora sp. NPDC050363]|uniref:threonine aldolase family protein n=1 Tax=Phytomonospora sp. NPDC050363 TaxID=3155642 RepID=UPI0033C591E4